MRGRTRGDGAGVVPGTAVDGRSIAKGFTPPHCDPMYIWTPAGSTMPFCVAATDRLSGCQTFGSVSVVPGLSKTSGALGDENGFGSA